MSLIVTKFGGTSMADAKQLKKVADIIKSDKSRRFVVPSAPGKRFSDDTKVTDMLYACYDLVESGFNFDEKFDLIKERYNSIISDLKLSVNLDKEFEEIYNNFKILHGRDYAASRGEYLSGIVLSAYLGFEFIDPAHFICFNEKGEFDSEKTNDIMNERLRNTPNAVIPGFYGAMPDGTVKTFSRGGSDITGSIVARAVRADLYENWNDVIGFLMADPRIVKDPALIKEITYGELRELSYMGATVLHEDAIFPVRFANIAINIRNTNEPTAPGTMIVSHSDKINENVITGIAGKKHFKVINIEKDMMNNELGFGRRVLQVLEDYNVSFEHLPSGVDTMSLVVASKAIKGKEDLIIEGIKKAVEPDYIHIDGNLSLIAVVGRSMKSAKGTAAKIFDSIAKADINVRMIDQGSSEWNVILGVNNDDFEKAINSIYNAFVK